MEVGLSGHVGVFCGRQVGAADPGASVFFCQLFPLLLTLQSHLVDAAESLLYVVEAAFDSLLDVSSVAFERYHKVGILLQYNQSGVLDGKTLPEVAVVGTESTDSVLHSWLGAPGHVDIEATKM